jgi:hypothetical protein
MTQPIEAAHKRRISVFALALVVPWIAVVRAAYQPIRDNSFLWHIRAGELQAEAGAVLTTDPFSIGLHGKPWVTQSWLVELFYSWGEGQFGMSFVPVTLILCAATMFVAIGLIAYRKARSILATSVVLVLTTVLYTAFLVPRPVLFSFPLFALVILAWERERTRWAVPFLFWLWASVHGSFAIGLVWIGLSIISDRDWKALKFAVPSGLMTLLTAHGLGVITMLLDFVGSSEYLDLISEWATPNLISVSLLPYFVGIVILIVGAMRGRLTARMLWVVVPFLALGFTAVRAVPPAWIGLTPFIAVGLQGVMIPRFQGFSRPVGLLIGALVILMPVLLLAGPPRLEEERFPEDASTVMADVPTFHDDVAGGYLIWRFGPERRVFIDDRAELFKERLREMVNVRNGREAWQPVFARDGIEQALLHVSDPLVASLESAGWAIEHKDEVFVLLRP